MDREIWMTLKQSVKRICRRVKREGRKPKFSNELILLMYLWSVCQGRCLNWAMDRSHYSICFVRGSCRA